MNTACHFQWVSINYWSKRLGSSNMPVVDALRDDWQSQLSTASLTPNFPLFSSCVRSKKNMVVAIKRQQQELYVSGNTMVKTDDNNES